MSRADTYNFISDPRTPMPSRRAIPTATKSPDAGGHHGVHQIDIHIGVTNEADFDRFYGGVPGRTTRARALQLGETMMSLPLDPAAGAQTARRGQPRGDVVASMRAVGMRYMTMQVRDGNATSTLHVEGVWEGAAPITLGEVARICFIRDPDGNWIEISQRASLTGPVPG